MSRLSFRSHAFLHTAFIAVVFLLLNNCQSLRIDGEPSIELTRIPPAADGSPERLETIEGRVRGARPGQRVVIFALSGVWWVQPMADHPFTAIQNDSTWKSPTHPGAAYAALLVDAQYRPPLTAQILPNKGGPVRAVITVPGGPRRPPSKTIQFSGYQWEMLQNTGDARWANFTDNAWVDDHGFLHLRAVKRGDQWLSPQVKLSRSLGYGSYRFVVHDISQLEPDAVFAMYTFDYLGPSREMDIEISRWGEPDDKNAQYVVQPYVVPANTVRFAAPAGPLTYWMGWEPGRVSFKTVRGPAASKGPEVVAEHVFSSGVPSAGNERIHLRAWVYGNKRHPMQREFEVVIEKFEFLP